MFYFLEDRHVQWVLFRVFVVGQECSTNSIVFVDCTLLDDLLLLTRYFVYNWNTLFCNSKVEMIEITHLFHLFLVLFFFVILYLLILCFLNFWLALGFFFYQKLFILLKSLAVFLVLIMKAVFTDDGCRRCSLLGVDEILNLLILEEIL